MIPFRKFDADTEGRDGWTNFVQRSSTHVARFVVTARTTSCNTLIGFRDRGLRSLWLCGELRLPFHLCALFVFVVAVTNLLEGF